MAEIKFLIGGKPILVFSVKRLVYLEVHIGNVNDLVFAIESDKPTIINPFDYHNILHLINQINITQQGIEYIRSNNNKGKFNFKYSWQRNNRREYDVRRGILSKK